MQYTENIMVEVQRTAYLDQLMAWKDKRVIKIITGLRRCGKSTLLRMFRESLLHSGVEAAQVISINMEDIAYESLQDYRILHQYIQDRLVADRMNYVFIDEVQNINAFQKAVDSLFLKENVDIYLTGSNAYLLSGEISTLLSGRFVEIEVLPFSLKEFRSVFKEDLPKTYSRYIASSSLPYAASLSPGAELNQYLQGVYNTVILKDIVLHNKLQHTDMLEKIIRYLCDNIGNISSLKNITDALSASSSKISQNTVDSYVDGLLNSYMFYKTPRYDVSGKELLRTGSKYYVADIGLRNLLLGIRPYDFGRILENVVFLELKRKGFQVFVGKAGTEEIDFVCKKGGWTEYFQVALSTKEEAVLTRELKPLLSLKDHYPKYLLTLDEEPESDIEGIRKLNALTWLAG